MSNKSIAAFAVLLIVLFSTLTYAFTKASNPLNRLDTISSKMADINKEQKKLQEKLAEIEMQIADNSGAIDALNDEATSIFVKLIQQEVPEVFGELSDQEEIELGIYKGGSDESRDGLIKMEEDTELYYCNHGNDGMYRGIKWRCNSNGAAQDMPELIGSGRHERMKELLSYYGQEELYDTFISAAKATGIYPELGICIAKADTTLGKHLKTPGNIGNVGNSDSGKTQSYNNLHAGVFAIFQTLNNKYLGNYSELWQLSRKYNKDGYVYATSEENHFNNVANCVGVINNQTIDEHWVYRF